MKIVNSEESSILLSVCKAELDTFLLSFVTNCWQRKEGETEGEKAGGGEREKKEITFFKKLCNSSSFLFNRKWHPLLE